MASSKVPPQKFDLLNGDQELVLTERSSMAGGPLTERDISSFLHPTLDELRKSIKLQNKTYGLQVDLDSAVMKVVVGYLGTIEMPKENQVLQLLVPHF